MIHVREEDLLRFAKRPADTNIERQPAKRLDLFAVLVLLEAIYLLDELAVKVAAPPRQLLERALLVLELL